MVFSVFRLRDFTIVWEIKVYDALESNKVEITFPKIRILPSNAAFPVSLDGWVDMGIASMVFTCALGPSLRGFGHWFE